MFKELVRGKMHYSLVADLVLITHALYVIFIVGGLLLVIIGGGVGWKWIRNFWFRLIHLIAIGVVSLQSWLEILCPLTTLEIYLREKAGQTTYQETFIAHWLHKILFYEAPMWVFSVCYTLFGLAVILTWIYIPPRIPWKSA